MKYKIVTPGNSKLGSLSKVVSLAEISRTLRLSSEVSILKKEVEVYLGPISHKTLVFFAVEFADYALKNYEKGKISSSETCIALTRKWLEDQESVSNEELRDAAYYAASDCNTAPAYAAAYSAVNAAYATNAAYASANAAADNRDKEFLRQGKFILDFLKSGKHLFSM
jgi:hypothetical protein